MQRREDGVIESAGTRSDGIQECATKPMLSQRQRLESQSQWIKRRVSRRCNNHELFAY